MLNRASRDWHTRIVTLNGVKGLAVRFFAALSMTVLRNSMVKCTNVLNSGLGAKSRTTEKQPSSTVSEQADLIVRNGRIATQDERRIIGGLLFVASVPD